MPITINPEVIQNHLQAAINWAADLNSSNSDRWPLHLGGWAIGEAVILVLNDDGHPQAVQREWKPAKFWPQNSQDLIASIFHVDRMVTVVLGDGYEDMVL